MLVNFTFLQLFAWLHYSENSHRCPVMVLMLRGKVALLKELDSTLPGGILPVLQPQNRQKVACEEQP